jgi:hypothetical protein
MIQQELLADPKPPCNDTRRLIVGYASTDTPFNRAQQLIASKIRPARIKIRGRRQHDRSKILAARAKDSRLTSYEDKESTVIKPLEEYTPDERAFVEWVQQLRSQPPEPPNNPGPFNWEEVQAIIAQVPEADRRELGEAIRQGRNR